VNLVRPSASDELCANAWFDRSTQLTALRPSKGKLTTLTHSTLLRVILTRSTGLRVMVREIEP